MLDHTVRRIRHILDNYKPSTSQLKTSTSAAVALILQPREKDLHLLFIHRAHNPQDPWSGHMAFPGGRKNPGDDDLCETIHRETKEEVGIDLALHGEYLGRMAELQAMSHGRPIDMTIVPFVYLISSEVKIKPAPVEVQDTIWVPLEFLQQDQGQCREQSSIPDGKTCVPALVYGGKTIWGLTYQMLREFLKLIAKG